MRIWNWLWGKHNAKDAVIVRDGKILPRLPGEKMVDYAKRLSNE